MEVCSNVVTESELQQLNSEVLRDTTANKNNEVHLDIVADGFWGPGRERNYLDIQVFKTLIGICLLEAWEWEKEVL